VGACWVEGAAAVAVLAASGEWRRGRDALTPQQRQRGDCCLHAPSPPCCGREIDVTRRTEPLELFMGRWVILRSFCL
jgi:hypothetical protein